jgi:hypothetical protein
MKTPSAFLGTSGPCPLQKLVQPDLERGLGSAHLARDFLDAPLNRLSVRVKLKKAGWSNDFLRTFAEGF